METRTLLFKVSQEAEAIMKVIEITDVECITYHVVGYYEGDVMFKAECTKFGDVLREAKDVWESLHNMPGL